ncbi:hypothetical protein M8J77_018657 [Diaphorina citri]|nr:hypothetical protein M8J77_018657 [Diaphorina citri]
MAPLAGGSHSSLSIDAFLLESFQVWVARPRFCLVNVLDRISDPDFDTSNRSYPKDLKKSPNTEDFEYKSRLPESTRAVYLVNVKLMAKAVQQLKQIIIDKSSGPGWGRERPVHYYPDGHPFGYQPRETLLNFSELLGTGAFNVLSPLSDEGFPMLYRFSLGPFGPIRSRFGVLLHNSFALTLTLELSI